MGLFDRVLKEHKDKAQAAADSAAKAAQDAQNALAAFSAEFKAKVEAIAKPALQSFADEAVKAGFQARIEDENEKGLPSVVLHFTSHPIATLGLGRSHQCAYRLGVTHDCKVQHQRIGDSSMEPFTSASYGLASINPEVIERELGELLARALQSSRA